MGTLHLLSHQPGTGELDLKVRSGDRAPPAGGWRDSGLSALTAGLR